MLFQEISKIHRQISESRDFVRFLQFFKRFPSPGLCPATSEFRRSPHGMALGPRAPGNFSFCSLDFFRIIFRFVWSWCTTLWFLNRFWKSFSFFGYCEARRAVWSSHFSLDNTTLGWQIEKQKIGYSPCLIQTIATLTYLHNYSCISLRNKNVVRNLQYFHS